MLLQLQVAAYRYLARYTPDKDLRKPVDRWAVDTLNMQCSIPVAEFPPGEHAVKIHGTAVNMQHRDANR